MPRWRPRDIPNFPAIILAMEPRGAFKIRDGWGGQHSAWIDYGTKSFEVPEDQYRSQGYQPPFDDLPWKASEPFRSQEA